MNNKDKTNIFLPIVAAALLTLASWALINTVQLKVDVAVIREQVANLSSLLRTHINGQAVSSMWQVLAR